MGRSQSFKETLNIMGTKELLIDKLQSEYGGQLERIVDKYFSEIKNDLRKY